MTMNNKSSGKIALLEKVFGPCKRRAFACLFLSGFLTTVQAESISLAVNAGTGDSNNIYATEDTYRPFAKLLSKALGSEVVAKPLLASLVKSSINGNRYPLLLVHTHDAAEAIKSKQYVAVGYSLNVVDNRVLVIARSDSTAKTLQDLAGRCVVTTDPFATATAAAILKREKVFDKLQSFKHVREGQSLEFYLKTRSCEIAILRSTAIAKQLEAAGNKQIYSSPQYPVFVLLADKKLGDVTIEKLRKLVVDFQADPNSNFIKETGVVTFVTDEDGAIELLNMY
jgi:ABC-type phosphate/phosphonate transport system substrate-binding protein